jgi:alpha-glucosidase (family GH31 glycosyl hydrolase)
MSSKKKIWTTLLLLIVMSACSSVSRPVWEKGKFKIMLENKQLQLYHEQTKIVEIKSFSFNFVESRRILVEKVTADSLILKLLLGESNEFNADFPTELLLTITNFNNTFHFYTSNPRFNHICIQLQDQDEHYFGLIEKLYPHNAKSPDLRGNTVDVEVYGNGNQDYAENYTSAYSAFFMSSQGYSSFFDTFAKGRYQLGINGITEIYHQTNALDWYIFYGPTGKQVHQEYFNLIGKPKSIPIWACGPIFWRDQNDGGRDEILDDIQKFTELEIPLTACWVDRPYSNGSHEWSKMDFNEKFSEPEKWIKTINEKYGMQFMTWIGPMTFSDPDFPGLLNNYKNYIDLTNPDALAEFERRLVKYQYSAGVRGHKMDRSDENFPLTAKWFEPISESESRNKYVFLYSKVINDFLSRVHGKNQFNFARAAFHRTQPYLSAIWGGDSRSNWLGMAGSQANAIRCGFMGFPVWGNDTGGYLGEGRIDEKLYIRWLQWSVWNGMFEVKIDGSGGSGEDRPPWKYPEQLQNIFRNVCQLRMELLPYIYSCANTSYKNGVIMKPLAYVYPEDANTYAIWDEYIFGDAFLLAPVFTANDQREIYLPQGKWYDFHNPQTEYIGPKTIKQNVPLDSTPIFLKANSIYLTGDIFRGNSKLWQGNLTGNESITIHLTPGKSGEQTTFNYIDYLDNDSEKTMKLANQHKKISFTCEPIMSQVRIEIRAAKRPAKVLLNDSVADFIFDESRSIIQIDLEKNTPIKLEII